MPILGASGAMALLTSPHRLQHQPVFQQKMVRPQLESSQAGISDTEAAGDSSPFHPVPGLREAEETCGDVLTARL